MIKHKLKKELEDSEKIDINDLKSFKTSGATIRYGLKKKGVYLPNHFRKQTSIGYMKSIISGDRKFKLTKDIRYVDVP